MSIKKLRNQLFAAIAMVLVASIALGSSTYAWFVSNSQVEATTTAISAQSNSAYLVIDKEVTTASSTYQSTIDTLTSPGNDTKLYPVEWSNHFAAGGVEIDAGNPAIYQFESAYALNKDNALVNESTRFLVGSVEDANTKDYALSHTFYVGTGTYDGEFSKLKVSNMTVTDSTTTGLKTAMRVLVEAYAPGSYDSNPISWVVAKYDGSTLAIESKSTNLDGQEDGVVYVNQFGKAEGDVKLVLTEYYDGDDENVKTTNLLQLQACSTTLTFTATPKEFK